MYAYYLKIYFYDYFILQIIQIHLLINKRQQCCQMHPIIGIKQIHFKLKSIFKYINLLTRIIV